MPTAIRNVHGKGAFRVTATKGSALAADEAAAAKLARPGAGDGKAINKAVDKGWRRIRPALATRSPGARPPSRGRPRAGCSPRHQTGRD